VHNVYESRSLKVSSL